MYIIIKKATEKKLKLDIIKEGMQNLEENKIILFYLNKILIICVCDYILEIIIIILLIIINEKYFEFQINKNMSLTKHTHKQN